jgi:hypothetical protein
MIRKNRRFILKESRAGRRLNEDPFYDLRAQYDPRKSFYSRAMVDTGDRGDENVLYSYNTKVAEMINGRPVVYDTYSATTLRHIKEWLLQNGFRADSKAQIMRDYGYKDESLNRKYRKSERKISESFPPRESEKAFLLDLLDNGDVDAVWLAEELIGWAIEEDIAEFNSIHGFHDYDREDYDESYRR